MLRYKISDDDIIRALEYKSMIESGDEETSLLGIGLAEAEFGKYQLQDSIYSLTLSQIIYRRKYYFDKKRYTCYWLYLVSIKYGGDYLFFEENSLSN